MTPISKGVLDLLDQIEGDISLCRDDPSGSSQYRAYILRSARTSMTAAIKRLESENNK